MTKEERVLKVLAGLYMAKTSLHLGNERGLIRDDINSGIMVLDFSAHNAYQMGKDLEFLADKSLLEIVSDGNKIRYYITTKGARVAKNMIEVWNALRKDRV